GLRSAGLDRVSFPGSLRRPALARGPPVRATPLSVRPGARMPTSVARRAAPRGDVDIARMYLSGIGQHQLLTRDDEARLGAAVSAGAEARALLESGVHLDPAAKRRARRAVREGDDAVN